MTLKKNNVEWFIECFYYAEDADIKKERFHLSDHIVIGAEIRNMTTGELFIYNINLISKMTKLGIVQDRPSISKRVVPRNYFDGIIHDESFLDKYMYKRPSWDEYFMAAANIMSTRSTCDRLFVGCVIVKDNRIIGEGYNGSIAGHAHCNEVGHLEVEENGRISCKRTIHAEANALNNTTVSPEGATAYVTHYPCPECMKALNQAGIKEVVYGSLYQHRYDNDFHDGMTLREFKGRRLKFEWVGNKHGL